MPTESSVVYKEIDDMLKSYRHGIRESCFEATYKARFQRSLDYNSLGVETIEELLVKMCDEGTVLFCIDPEDTKERFVTLSSYVYQDMPTESPVVYEEIEDMLINYRKGIQESCFETSYKDKYKRSLDYNSLGVETIEELLAKLCVEGIVLFYNDPETNERYVTLPCLYKGSSEIQDMPPTESSDRPTTESSEIHNRPTESSDLYQEIQYILTGYIHGITMHWLEKRYRHDFFRSPDYGSVGVKTIKELIGKMHDKGRVLLYKDPESKETYVMCAWLLDILRKLLKRDVLKLLNNHGGEILLSRFDRVFKDMFMLELKYHRYGLTGPDHLCQVLNLGLEEADSPPGEMVIKARKIQNLRKRKRNG